jgi:MYXO-CTERM domain-containing protein
MFAPPPANAALMLGGLGLFCFLARRSVRSGSNFDLPRSRQTR